MAKVKKLKRPRYGPSRTRGRLNPGTRKIRPAYSAYRRPWRQEDPGGGSDYYMNTDNSAIQTNLTGQNFWYFELTRTHIDSNGVMQFTPTQTPRVEADGILFENRGANVLLQSRNFATVPWNNLLPDMDQDQTGVDGVANKAWTIEDIDPGYVDWLYYDLNISPTNPKAVFSIFVKKDSDTSRFPEFQLNWTFGTSKSLEVQLNTSTGATYIRTNDTGNGSVSVVDYTDWWRIILTDTDTGNNAQLQVLIAPAITTTWQTTEVTALGAIIIDCAQLEFSNMFPDVVIGTSYKDNDGVAIGSDIASDPDCDLGTLNAGSGWVHDAINDEYDATASTGDLSDSEILDFDDVYRIKTVWANITGGSVKVVCGNGEGQDITADGTYYDYVITNNPSLVFRSTGFTGSLQSYEVVKHGTDMIQEELMMTFDLPDPLFEEDRGSIIQSGTLPAGNLYKINDTQVNHFYVGCADDEYFVSVGTETCNGSNRVRQITNAWDSGDGLCLPHGTSIIWWKPGSNRDDALQGHLVHTHSAGLNSLIAGHAAGGNLYTDASTVEPTVVFDYQKDTFYKIVVQWGYLTDHVAYYRIGYDSGSGVVWGTALVYDGAYGTGASLQLAGIIGYPYHIKRLRFYKSILTNEEIDATPAPDA